jgi:hypothetical protein
MLNGHVSNWQEFEQTMSGVQITALRTKPFATFES